jgi:tetratricopeptide (TPR) repeat protein
MKDALEQARQLAAAGKFEEALQKHIWFHNHALEVDPAYYGVRLSFALADWVELGRKYPPALTALQKIRDEKTSRLVNGLANRDLFHDVESINEYLDESAATVALFKKIEGKQPDFAASVYDLADEALILAGEYALARKYLGDPMFRFETAKRHFEDGMRYAKTSEREEASRRATEHIFTDEIVRIVNVLDKAGDQDRAREIQSKALAVLNNPTIRGAITN